VNLLIAITVIVLSGAFLYRRKDKEANETEEKEPVTDDTKTAPADPAAWRMLPERFPPGVTFDQIKADNARIRGQIPSGYQTSTTQAANARAGGYLGSLPFGAMTTFEIDGVTYVAIKEWHAPHVPPVGPPHRWHHGISVFQPKGA